MYRDINRSLPSDLSIKVTDSRWDECVKGKLPLWRRTDKGVWSLYTENAEEISLRRREEGRLPEIFVHRDDYAFVSEQVQNRLSAQLVDSLRDGSPELIIPAMGQFMEEFLIDPRSERLELNLKSLLGFVDFCLRERGALRPLRWITEAHSQTTAHVLTVTALLIEVCQKLQMSDREMKTLGLASLLYDVGMSRLPIGLLNCRDKFSDKQHDAVKLHVILGAELLEACNGKIGNDVRIISFQHHERINGEGYPLKLSADGIVSSAKLLACVDSVVGMTRTRAYRPKHYTFTEAIVAMIGCGQFDKEACDVLIRTLGPSEQSNKTPKKRQ